MCEEFLGMRCVYELLDLLGIGHLKGDSERSPESSYVHCGEVLRSTPCLRRSGVSVRPRQGRHVGSELSPAFMQPTVALLPPPPTSQVLIDACAATPSLCGAGHGTQVSMHTKLDKRSAAEPQPSPR